MLYAPSVTVDIVGFGNQWLQWGCRAGTVKRQLFFMKENGAYMLCTNAWENSSKDNGGIITSWQPNVSKVVFRGNIKCCKVCVVNLSPKILIHHKNVIFMNVD